MSLFSDPRVTRPLSNAQDDDAHRTRATQPLSSPDDWLANTPTASLPRLTRPPNTPATPVTAIKPLVVIPATEKPRRTDALEHQHRRSPIALLGVLLTSIIVIAIATYFVAPLNNGQHSQSLVQTVNDWFAHSQSSSINPAQQVEPPTATPALLTNEGYCGGTDIWGMCATAVTQSGLMGTGQMQRPIQGATITQVFAHPEYQLWCSCWKPHTGIDLAAPYGTAVMAADNGQVIWTGWDWSGLGWAVKINHGHYIATIYGHLERFTVKVGEDVTKGQVIGYEGSTGASTGPHLHFMVLVNNIWMDPTNYVQLP